MKEKLFGYIDAQQDLLLDLQRGMTALPAIGPDNNGSGEAAKAEFIKERLAALGFPPVHSLNSPDPRVPAGFRPNFYTVLPGKDCSKTLWIAAHIDVVPPGDRALWRTDPFNLHVEGDFIYGRGVEDNQQAITSAIIAAKALLDLNLAPACNLGLLFLSDEETNNQHGAIYVAENCSNLFGPNDMMLVPDAGDQAGSLLEVAEKGVLWLKFTVNGRQCHASTPNQGVNSLLGAADLILRLNRLNDIFNLSDPLFDPPTSTFTPTQKEANVPNVNTMPGRDVFYLDCRILPDLSGDVVLTKVRELMRETEAALGDGFARCCSSFLVNLRSVAAVEGKGVVLKDGTRLLLSRNYKNKFMEAIARLMSGRRA